jgi:hypothetical protein
MKGLWTFVHRKSSRLLGWLEGGVALILFSSPSPLLAQFSVSQISPSPPYSTSAGSLMVGDFNGDGLSDVIQMDSSGHVHVWLSQGDGKFEVKEFSMGPPDPGKQALCPHTRFSSSERAKQLRICPLVEV